MRLALIAPLLGLTLISASCSHTATVQSGRATSGSAATEATITAIRLDEVASAKEHLPIAHYHFPVPKGSKRQTSTLMPVVVYPPREHSIDDLVRFYDERLLNGDYTVDNLEDERKTKSYYRYYLRRSGDTYLLSIYRSGHDLLVSLGR